MAQVVFDEWKDVYRAEGRIEGEAKGRAEGEAKGRWEEKLDIALNLLRANAAVELVEAATGLPPEKVRELAAGLKRD